MDTQGTAPNPYKPDAPAIGERFMNREEVIAWVENRIETGNHAPMLILGEAGMGKTSLLLRLQQCRLPHRTIPIFLDFAAWRGHGLPDLIHYLVDAIKRGLAEKEIVVDLPGVGEITEDPIAAFSNQIVNTAVAHGRSLLLLADNLHLLLNQVAIGVLPEGTIANLWRAIQSETRLFTLWTINPSQEITSDQKKLLEEAASQELKPLNLPAAAALIEQNTSSTIVSDVIEYIYQITGGHPQKLQHICHQIFERQQNYRLIQITIADVAAIAADSHRATPTTAAYSLRPTPDQDRQIRQSQRSRYRTPWLILGGLLAILLISAIAIPALARQPLPVLIGLVTPTPTDHLPASFPIIVSATPSTTPTATSTPRSTTTPAPTTTSRPTATPSATPTRIVYDETRLREADSMTMLLVPGDTFLMGSETEDFIAGPDEKPHHPVTLDTFYIDKYEVTIAQYAAFLTRLGDYRQACAGVDCAQPREFIGFTSYLLEQDLGDGSLVYVPQTGFANYPINNVSWYGAKAYCESVGARLPTEAEWEFAARGTDGRIYPWGNDPPDPSLAVYQSADYDNLKPVDALPAGASPYGALGMAGSMWEWTADWYDETYYSVSPRTNPTGPETGITRVIRGGAWPNNNEADRIRATNRSSLTPDFISAIVGFRCAADP